jgi:putative molybdopterin biosynthesis protein
MGIYLSDIPLPEAKARFQSALISAGLWRTLGVEEIPLDESALGRVLAEPIWAGLSSPHYHAAAMDGFAVRSKETSGALPTRPVQLQYGEQVIYLDTGDALPIWADAVIPIENIEPLDEFGQTVKDSRHPSAIQVRQAAVPWSHVRAMGEDIVATQLVLPAGQILGPVDLGAIAASGHDRVRVARRPKVAIIPTGNELVPIGHPVEPGVIIEYNSLVLAAQIDRWGGEARRFPIVEDNFESICKAVREATQNHDLVLLNAGSSAGSEDFSARVVQALGQLLVHGVAVRPGHPVILGMVHDHTERQVGPGRMLETAGAVTPIIGVPGYPVSAALTGEIFVEPLLARWLGRVPIEPPTIRASITRKITSPAGDDDYVRVAVGCVGERLLAAPLARGAGVITSLVRADGLAIIPRGSQGLPAGAEVDVLLYRSLAEIERTIFAVGSHDIALDILAQFLAERGRRLASASVGSLGGLVALQRGEAHLAGTHLLDPDTGEYNLRYIRQYLTGVPVQVLMLVKRQQGLIVQHGNPKSIHSLKDLTRSDLVFINRQRGAGTRVLLDYHLNQIGISTQAIRGYEVEEYTHLSVAAAIASGRADCGLGIAAAAQALELTFVPLYEERYELVIPKIYADSPLLLPLFDILSDPHFRELVESLPGYDASEMGVVVTEIE